MPSNLTFDSGTAVMFVYTLGAVVSGVFLQQSMVAYAATWLTGSFTSRVAILGGAALVALLWTLYCEWTVLERLPGYTDPQANGDA